MLRVQLDRQLVQIDFWHPQHSPWSGISTENEFVASTEATQKQNESYATATIMEPYFKTLRGHKALGFLKWPSCSWRSIVPEPSSSISAKTSAFAGWNMTSSTNFNKTAPQERLEKNMLLFLWWTRKWGFLLNSKFHQISSATRCDYKHNGNEHLPRAVPSRDLHHFGRKLPHLSYCQYRYPLGEKNVGVSSFK